jgi:hypothetical protein
LPSATVWRSRLITSKRRLRSPAWLNKPNWMG